MPPTNPPDPLLQRLGAIEQRLQAIERAQGNAVLTVARQLEAFIRLRNLIGPIPGQLHGWPISADFARRRRWPARRRGSCRRAGG